MGNALNYFDTILKHSNEVEVDKKFRQRASKQW
jgi:hypothetical protein